LSGRFGRTGKLFPHLNKALLSYAHPTPLTMTVFQPYRPFWKRLVLQAAVMSIFFAILLGALLIAGKTDFDWQWTWILLILLGSLLMDHLNKENIKSVSFDANRQQLLIEYFALFKNGRTVAVPFDKLSFKCFHQRKQSTLFIYGFTNAPIVLDLKFRGFSNEQINHMQTHIWSLHLPIETKADGLSFRNY
jgi:hypothetical protein